MNRVRGVLGIHRRYHGMWFAVPWLVLASSFVVNIVLAAVTGAEFHTLAMMSVHLTALAAGVLIMMQTFPFALGLGVRRADYFVGTVAAAALVSAGSAVLLTLLTELERNMHGLWGGRMHFFRLPFDTVLTPVKLASFHFMLMTVMFLTGFLIFSVFARYGRPGMVAMFVGGPAVLSVLAFAITHNGWWPPLIAWLLDFSALPLRLLPIAVFLALVMNRLLRRCTV